MLIACIPLVLCIGVYSVFILPAMVPADKDPSNKANGSPEYVEESFSCAISQIYVSGPGVSLTFTDVSDILLISDRLNTYTLRLQEPSDNMNVTPTEEADGQDGLIGSAADPSGVGYLITLVAHAGGSTEYSLVGNTLTDLSSGKTYTLTSAQASELNTLLGLSGTVAP